MPKSKYLLAHMGSFLLGLFLLSFGITANAQIEMYLETPASGETIATVLFVRGWATAPTGIDRVELLVNNDDPIGGTGAFVIPIGESRPDVGDLFPTFPGSENSGFNLAFFFTRDTFPVGINSVTVTAFDKAGNQRSISVNYTLSRFETGEPNNFIRDTSKISLLGASASVSGNAVLLNNAIVDGQSYDIVIRFKTSLQGFVNTQITKSGGTTPSGEITPGLWLGQQATNPIIPPLILICFNVSADGTRLTAQGSPCETEIISESLDIKITNLDDCEAELETNADIPIVNTTFSHQEVVGNQTVRVTGTFQLPNFASGTVRVTNNDTAVTCEGSWIATPF